MSNSVQNGGVSHTINYYNSLLVYTSNRYARIKSAADSAKANNIWRAPDIFSNDIISKADMDAKLYTQTKKYEIKNWKIVEYPDPKESFVDEDKEQTYYDVFVEKCKQLHLNSDFEKIFDKVVKHFKEGSDFGQYNQPDYYIQFKKGTYDYHKHDYSEFNWQDERTDFEDSELTEEVFNHSSTKKYIDEIKEMYKNLFGTWNGDLTYIETESKLAEIRSKMEKDVKRPSFNNLITDGLSGLKILINDTWAAKHEFKNLTINKSDRFFEGKLVVTIFDHFGLDDSDYDKFGDKNYFRYWYLLQRYSGFPNYKAFVTKFTREYDFLGEY